jgi:beta-lactamase superfamily II metal-dependent hydrolase
VTNFTDLLSIQAGVSGSGGNIHVRGGRSGEVAFMITSDAGEEAEQVMLSAEMPLQSQVLQVGHHGAKDANSPEWLSAVNPVVAVIPCGRNKNYGHPSRRVISYLQSRNIQVERTDVHGAVAFTTDGKVIKIRLFAAP